MCEKVQVSVVREESQKGSSGNVPSFDEHVESKLNKPALEDPTGVKSKVVKSTSIQQSFMDGQ